MNLCTLLETKLIIFFKCLVFLEEYFLFKNILMRRKNIMMMDLIHFSIGEMVLVKLLVN